MDGSRRYTGGPECRRRRGHTRDIGAQYRTQYKIEHFRRVTESLPNTGCKLKENIKGSPDSHSWVMKEQFTGHRMN